MIRPAIVFMTLFLAPLAQSVPAYATAAALLFVACLMVRGLGDIDWEDLTGKARRYVVQVAESDDALTSRAAAFRASLVTWFTIAV